MTILSRRRSTGQFCIQKDCNNNLFKNGQKCTFEFSRLLFQPARLPEPPLSHIRMGRQTIHVPKCSSTLGIAIEGGANTKQPLPRIISIQPNGAAFQAGGLRIGQLIKEVDGIGLEGEPKHVLPYWPSSQTNLGVNIHGG